MDMVSFWHQAVFTISEVVADQHTAEQLRKLLNVRFHTTEL